MDGRTGKKNQYCQAMGELKQGRFTSRTGFIWLVSGLLAMLLGWFFPSNIGSITVPVIQKAGEGSLSLAKVGLRWTQSEKMGPASLLLRVAENLGDPEAPILRKSFEDLVRHNPQLITWGGYDPFLDPLVKLQTKESKAESRPVIELLVKSEARSALRSYLANSRSLGVQALLRLHEVGNTGRFVQANKPGGQALDTLILVSALLYQGEHLSPSLQREMRSFAETAVQQNKLGELEPLFLDLLSLSKRLDWVQLCELLRRSDDFKTVGEYAHLSRVAPDDFTLIYAAALFTESADSAAAYLLQYGRAGLDDMRFAMRQGQGATRLLLARQLPINRSQTASLGFVAELDILHPRVSILIRWLGFLAGAFCLLKGLDRLLFSNEPGASPALPHAKCGILALILAGLLALGTEPFLLKAAPISEFTLRLSLPALASNSIVPEQETGNSFTSMDTKTLLSIGFFASLQVVMYLICLSKIREIARRQLDPLIKFKLMETEENLFDGGLYIGIAGTASALVLQVLQIIEPNLLAAYSSNLFGIICVALVKIRHVRPYKSALILQAQEALVAARQIPS
jgi:hypothetical protein